MDLVLQGHDHTYSRTFKLNNGTRAGRNQSGTIYVTSVSGPKSYTGNRFTEDLTGFRLICPKEPDTARYLDDVVRISYDPIPLRDGDLLPRRKKFRCRSESIVCIDKAIRKAGVFKPLAAKTEDRWVRIGHGHGYDDIVVARGHDLRSFLTTNFSGAGPDDFFSFCGL